MKYYCTVCVPAQEVFPRMRLTRHRKWRPRTQKRDSETLVLLRLLHVHQGVYEYLPDEDKTTTKIHIDQIHEQKALILRSLNQFEDA